MNKKPSTFILFVFISAAPFNAVLYAPALPGLTHYLSISKDQAQLTIATFLLGYALSQFIFGPIANAFGRKNASIIGITTGILGTLLCILSGLLKQYDLLIIGRLISALGVSSGVTLTYTMINDSYDDIKARQITGYCVLSFAIAPGAANFVGGIITGHFGWMGCFYFLLLYNTFLLLILLNLSETLTTEKRVHFNVRNIIRGYTGVFKNLKVILLSIMYGFKTAALYAIVTLIPFIAIHTLKMTPAIFGTVFFSSYSGYILGTLIANRLVTRINAAKSVLIGMCFSTFGGFLMLGFSLLHQISVYSMFASIAIIMLGFPFVFINASMMGIKAHDKDRANASSVFNFISIFMAFLTVTILGTIKHDTPLLLATCTLILSLMAIFFYYINCKAKNRNK